MHDNLSWEIPNYNLKELSEKKADNALIVITWNEGKKLKKQLEETQDYLPSVDIIIVDGGSTDGSTETEFLKSQNVCSLLTTTEPGLGCAIRVGLSYCLKENYKHILTIDSNGKDCVDAIPSIIEKLDEGYDMVQASRFMKGGTQERTPFFRLLGIHLVIIPWLALGGGFWFTDPTNGFKGFSRDYLLSNKVQPFRDIFVKFNMQFYLNYSAAKNNFKVIEVPAKRIYPEDGSVPTKIHGLKTHFRIISEIFTTCVGGYNP